MTMPHTNEDYDRLARLCEAKDQQITLLSGVFSREEELKAQLSEIHAQIAMLTEALNEISPFGSIMEHCAIAKKALSATSETVAAWRAKETEPLLSRINEQQEFLDKVRLVYPSINWIGATDNPKGIEAVLRREIDKATEPLRREVAMLRDLCIWLSGCGYDFCQHEYWISHRAAIGDTKATALAYERGVENRGAVKALENMLNVLEFDRLLTDDEQFIDTFDDGVSAVERTLNVKIAELRANKGEVK